MSVTLNNYGKMANMNTAEFYGKSTDEKPTEQNGGNIINGSIYVEIDTGRAYFYDAEMKMWTPVTPPSADGTYTKEQIDVLLDKKMSYYIVTVDGNKIVHEGETLTYAKIQQLYEDESVFIYMEHAGLTLIPSVDVDNSIIAFSSDWMRKEGAGYEPFIYVVQITSDNTVTSQQFQIEDVANKVTAINSRNATSEEKYPSVKAVVDYVGKDGINAEITDIKEDLSDINLKLKEIEFDVNGVYELTFTNKGNEYIDTSVSPVDVNTLVSGATNTWRRCVVSCDEGDTFKVSALGGNRARAWAFLDNQNNIILSSEPNADLAGEVITAPESSNTLIIQTFDYDTVERKSYRIKSDNTISLSAIDERELCEYFGILSNGTIESSNNLSVTSFIPCIPNTEIELSVLTIPTTASKSWGYCFYNKDKIFISGVPFVKKNNDWGCEIQKITIPKNAYYLRTCFASESIRNANSLTFTGLIPQNHKYREYQDGYIFFSSKVNQSVNNYWNTDAETELSENMKMTTGVLALPESYSPNGNPTPLIMYFHGYSHGVWYNTWGADDEFRLQKQHWLEKGFAVMDCNGARNNNKIAQFTSGGSRQYVDGYRKCFEYVKEHYNVEDDIYVVAGSAGGIAGINYSMWYQNVKAMCLLSAWTDLLLCSWNQNIRDTIEEYLGFTNTTDYEVEKTKGFDPALRIITVGETEYLPMLKVPTLALIGSTETTSVFYNPLHRFINAARNAGNTASIRVIDGATHKNIVSGGVQFIDDEVANWFKSN